MENKEGRDQGEKNELEDVEGRLQGWKKGLENRGKKKISVLDKKRERKDQGEKKRREERERNQISAQYEEREI